MFRRRRASEPPRDESVEPAVGADGSDQVSSVSGSGAESGADVTPLGGLTEQTTRMPGASARASAANPSSPSPAASDSKGSAMSASTPPRSPGQGFVPEIPRRSASDIPGAPPRRPSNPGRGNEESKRLLVGKEISLSGEITACDSLVVEGTVQATLQHSQSLEVTETGLYKGTVTIEEAVIAGRFEGDLTVRGTLSVKSTGILEGTVRFHRLEVELGGVIKGDIAPLTEE
ncbi:MAG: polymer-forming cytoskeletal protein [Alphaproteobacteria bacterium]|nr:polymer-forming cytoskeletal protein [Alphaproteobacteria bacterium]